MKTLSTAVVALCIGMCTSGVAQTHTYHGIHSVGANGYLGPAPKGVDYRNGHITITSYEVAGQGMDVFLTRGDTCNGYGTKLQYYTSPGVFDEVGCGVEMDNAGDMWVVGRTNGLGAGGNDVFLIKADTAVNLPMEFAFTYGGPLADEAFSLDLTTDGGAVLCGQTGSFGAGALDGYVIKVDPNGNQQWARAIGGPGDDVFFDVTQTADDGYMLVGYSTSFSPINHMFFVKLDAAGTVVFAGHLGLLNVLTEANSVHQTADGGYILNGNMFDFGPTLIDGYVVKLDAAGNVEWDRRFAGVSDDAFADICLTDDDADGQADDGYFVTGVTTSFAAGDQNHLYAKIDGAGNFTFGSFLDVGSAANSMASVEHLSFGEGYLMVGTQDAPGNPQLFVLKVDRLGEGNFFCAIDPATLASSTPGFTTNFIVPLSVPAMAQAAAPFTTYSGLQAIAVCCCDGFGGPPGCTPAPLALDGFEWVNVAQMGNTLHLTWEPLNQGFTRYEVWTGQAPDVLQQVAMMEEDVQEYSEMAVGNGMRYFQVVGITANGAAVKSEVRHIMIHAPAWNLSPSMLSLGQSVVVRGQAIPGESVTVRVVDAMGKTVAKTAKSAGVNGEVTLELSTTGMAPGMYFVQVPGQTLRFVVH